MSTHAYIPVHLDHPTDHFGEPGWVEGLPHDHTCRCECTDCYSDSNGCICPGCSCRATAHDKEAGQ